jgi:hypothetical protein
MFFLNGWPLPQGPDGRGVEISQQGYSATLVRVAEGCYR